MMRWDIINFLIRKHQYKSFLEIGYYKGWSFDRIECKSKYAVDPNPCKFPYQEQMPKGEMLTSYPTEDTSKEFIINKTTSDEYFRELPDYVKFDLVFIDGLHEAQQVDRDIRNALKHLSPSGTIVIHDCSPSSYEMTTTGTASGEWTGDVYKSFIDFKWSPENEKEYSCYVIDTDYGVGIIHKANKIWQMTRMNPLPSFLTDKQYYSFPVFNDHRKYLLHLITPNDFLFIDNTRRTAYNG